MKEIVKCSIHNKKIMILNLPKPINDLRNKIVKNLLEWDYKEANKTWKKMRKIIIKNQRETNEKR